LRDKLQGGNKLEIKKKVYKYVGNINSFLLTFIKLEILLSVSRAVNLRPFILFDDYETCTKFLIVTIICRKMAEV
jgi:hypothetical protein